MKGEPWRTLLLSLPVLLLSSAVMAAEKPRDLSVYLPAAGEVGGWTRTGEPQVYRGEDLYLMINGGAEIYHEYGFAQVLGAEYVDADQRPVRVEIYEMEDTAGAYGIYTFKVAYDGRPMAVGQGALLEGNYLNFWKGNIQVTVGGWQADEETVDGVVSLARAIDSRIPAQGEKPGLTALFLNEPLPLSQLRYVRGPLGVMNNSIFGLDNIFKVREGLIGTADHCSVLVFLYESGEESARVYRDATDRITENARFKNGVRRDTRFSVVGPKEETVTMSRKGQHILVVVGENSDEVLEVFTHLLEKLE